MNELPNAPAQKHRNSDAGVLLSAPYLGRASTAPAVDLFTFRRKKRRIVVTMGTGLTECRLSLERVVEGSNRSVFLLEKTVEKLLVLMATLKEAGRGTPTGRRQERIRTPPSGSTRYDLPQAQVLFTSFTQ
jgi:hypothetical protein